MDMLPLALKLASPLIVIVGLVHLVLGPGADVLLGANVPVEVLSDAVLDSQNRFYGVSFTLYGFVLFISSTDLRKYQVILYVTFGVFFAAGSARLVSIAVVGLPSESVLALLALELLLPPVCALWLKKSLHEYEHQ